MANETPNSYKDPYWTQLASATESKIGLPDGLLTAIVTKGERSNADQVSEAGAKTPFQIIPSTRKAAIEKFGIDPYLSPENAAEVAGLLLKDSLQRNKGDVVAAVSEYHGGTDRANWGPRTRSYVARVLGDQPAAQPPVQPTMEGQSTFQRALARQQQNSLPSSAIANIYQAYKSGAMTPEEKSQFEADVKSGLVMLPRGAALGDQQATAPAGKPDAVMLPPAVADAYALGKMTDQEKADLENDIKAGIVKIPARGVDMIPGGEGWVAPTEHVTAQQLQQKDLYNQQHPAPGIGQKLVGAGEAALTALTGATGGTLGMVGGTVKGITQSILNGTYGTQQAANLVEQQAMEGAQALTYHPRTEAGQEYAQNVGEAMQQVVPVMPLTTEMGMLGAGMRQARPAVATAARAVADPIKQGAVAATDATVAGLKQAGQAVAGAPGKIAELVGLKSHEDLTVAPGRASVGAAAVPADAVRAAKSQNLPVPVDLTLGAETRDAAQLAFEKEQMKGPLGAPLRARAEKNNLQALQNFETLIDSTDAATPDLAATGNAVTRALSEGYKAAKNKTRAAYKAAENSAEANAAVDATPVIDHLNSIPSGLKTTGLADHAKQYAVRLGIAEMDADGNLVPVSGKLNLPADKMQALIKDYVAETGKTNVTDAELAAFAKSKGISAGSGATVKQMEAWRKEISQATGFEPVEVRDSAILKNLIDTQTEPVAGPLYKEARALRTAQARKYENRAIVARLITNRKGMEDPAVAVDQVFNKSIINGSPEEITFLKRVLNTSGPDGQQAWKELQGATMKHIRDEATKGMGMDSADNPIISPAKLHQTVQALDKNGRLDLVLGKKNAETVRDLNDVVRYVNTTPPGTLINNSGTVGTLLAAMAEAGTTGALTGLPVPAVSLLRALSKQIGNNKMKLKIDKALNVKPSGKF